MSEYLRELVAASKRLRNYINFTVANEMAHPDDITTMKSWLAALSRYEHNKKRKYTK